MQFSHPLYSQAGQDVEYKNTLSLSTWVSLENPITGIKYQNNSFALGYFLNVKTDLDKFMPVAGPSFMIMKDHYLYLGGGSFDGSLALEIGITIQKRKLAIDIGLDYVPDDKFNFLVPTVGAGINF